MHIAESVDASHKVVLIVMHSCCSATDGHVHFQNWDIGQLPGTLKSQCHDKLAIVNG